MPEEPKKRRTPRLRRTVVMVDFTVTPNVYDWISERAAANCRTVSQEIVFRLMMSKKSIEAGSKNLKPVAGGMNVSAIK
jgi:hypothetical protein